MYAILNMCRRLFGPIRAGGILQERQQDPQDPGKGDHMAGHDLTAILPDGRSFGFWEEEVIYDRVLHVDCQSPAASDEMTAARSLRSEPSTAPRARLSPERRF